MIFYVFDTEIEAIEAEQIIVENIKNWVETYSPDAIGQDGESLKGRNGKTKELVNNYTSKWATPSKTLDGKWVFQKPQDYNVAPIPLASVVANLIANEEEYSRSWFPLPEELS